MLDKLIDMAKKYTDEVEIYQIDYSVSNISFENGSLKDIESSIQSGISLKIIKDGKLGFSYTKNLIDPEILIQNAIHSLKGDVKVEFSFPERKDIKILNTYDPEIENLTNTQMVEEGRRISEILSQKTGTQINVGLHKAVTNLRILNSKGVDYSVKTSVYYSHAEAMYPGSYSAIFRLVLDKKFKEFSQEDIDYITFL